MKLRLIRIIAIILLAVSGFAVIALLEIFGRTPERLTVPIPKDADWVLRVDAATLIKEEIFTVLYEAQDEQLIKTLRALAENSMEKDEKQKLFINIFSEMVVFGTEKQGHTFTGILLQLSNPEIFEKNIPSYLKENQTFAVNGTTGLILTRTDKKAFDKNNQNKLSVSLLENSSTTYLSTRERAENEYIQLEIKNQSGKLEKADLGFLFEKNALNVSGAIHLKQPLKMPAYDVKHESFYINSAFVTENLPKLMFSGMQLGNLNFPPLENISMNYSGIVIENGSSMFRLPKMNAVLTTKTAIRVEDLMKQVPAEFISGANTLKFSSTTYYLKQLDSKTIFFGVDPSSLLMKSPESPLMITGDLQNLSAVEADGMIMTGINILIPQYNSLNAFTKETEKADLKLTPHGKEYKVEGSLKFKDKSSSLAALTRLILGLQLIN